ncbi:tight adherence protein B [Murinocardiopsis flavida]|uniref:Tight adherence protein B n=1 Tax=Murinocardiopsis flavida TaxID=645275 RepID=A0A2P8DQF3_9ACTN|nr:type II secretion system F family protein [Murinocardiopsis flavida]PSK99422.1 tight adherence protein B [Murinocardiopsis flavida]
MIPAILLITGLVGTVVLQSLPSAAQIRIRLLCAPPADPAGTAVHRLWTAVRRRAAALRRREPHLWRESTIELCRVLAAELRAGRPPPEALGAAARELPPALAPAFTPVLAAARGGDPVAAMRALADRPGCAGIGYLSGCWRVASQTGGSLAEVVDRLAHGLAEEQSRRSELSAQLAGPRATAALLSALPVAGLAMSSGMGGRPLLFLCTTPVGLGCLVGGVALDLLGLWWTHRMTRRALDAGEPR